MHFLILGDSSGLLIKKGTHCLNFHNKLMTTVLRLPDKVKTYLKYFTENVKFGDFESIMSSVNYIMFRKTPSRNRLIESRQGLFFCRKHTTDFMYANYAYEYHLKKFIDQYTDKFKVYMDIGSCIGDYSIWLSGKGLKCHAFEPVESNFNSLKVNVLLNNLQDNVNLYNFGLGSKTEKVSFNITETNKGSCGIDKNCDCAEKNIQIRTLDEISDNLSIGKDEGVIMKLDVEGMEIDVLQGAREFIRDRKDLIIICECTLSTKDNIIDLLDSLGNFRYVDVDQFNFAAVKQ